MNVWLLSGYHNYAWIPLGVYSTQQLADDARHNIFMSKECGYLYSGYKFTEMSLDDKGVAYNSETLWI